MPLKSTTQQQCPHCGCEELYYDGEQVFRLLCIACNATGPTAPTPQEAMRKFCQYVREEGEGAL